MVYNIIMIRLLLNKGVGRNLRIANIYFINHLRRIPAISANYGKSVIFTFCDDKQNIMDDEEPFY